MSDRDETQPTESSESVAESNLKSKSKKAKYVWQRLWFQWVLGTLVVFLFLSFVIPPIFWLLSRLSSVLTPVLLGLGLAYIFNPVLIWAQTKRGIKRPVTAGLLLGLVVIVVSIVVPIVVVNAIDQGAKLSRNAPQYAETILGWIGRDVEDAREQISGAFERLDWTQVNADAAQQVLGVGAGAIVNTVGFLSYAAIFVLVTGFCFFVFSWKLPELREWWKAFVPRPYRPETFRILSMMDQTVAAIVRGRLVQSLVVGIILSTGWAIVGVPSWLLLGVLGGFLNLLPFAAVLSWPLAVILTMASAASLDESLLWAAIGPTIVYVVAQSLDGWVIEPLVQGQATGMDALTVLLVVLAGGALLGILGVVLAVPVAACIKILSQEILLPKLRRFAEDPPNLSQSGT